MVFILQKANFLPFFSVFSFMGKKISLFINDLILIFFSGEGSGNVYALTRFKNAKSVT